MADGAARDVIWIPIIHSQVDQGSMSESIRRAGMQKWQQQVRSVAARWRQIRENPAALHLGHHSVRLYQNGLPTCGHESNIAQDLAAAGSPDHRLLLNLNRAGGS
jgi:hypothetical protein